MSRSQHLQPVKLRSRDYFPLPSCISRHPGFVPSARDEWTSERGRESPSLLKYIQPHLRLGITNDIMAICHAPQFSDVLPTHLLWYLVTDPAANQRLVMGLRADPPLRLPNDLEGNRRCQCLEHVLHWQSSRALSKGLPYKLSRSLCF